MKFNDYQKIAINKVDGNICVIATAGSGKTSVLVERINHMVEDCNISPDKILAVSFSKKACTNMVDKLVIRNDKLSDVTVKTFHALAYGIVRAFYGNKYTLWTKGWEKEQMLYDICNDLHLCSNKDDLPVAKIFVYINTQKVNMLKPSAKLIDVNDVPYPKPTMKKIYKMYEERKLEQGYIEFEDLVNMVCDIFDKSQKTLDIYKERFQYILVDEYQDISLNQHCLLKYLNGSNNLFVVGDSLQAIYSFRGGSCKYLLNFENEWDNATVINLPINYRCSSDIITTANQLATFLPDYKNIHYKPAIADSPANIKPVFCGFDKAIDEYTFISNIIEKGIKNGYSYNDFAILGRTNAQVQTMQNMFANSDIGVDMTDTVSFFELPEIKLVLSFLKLAVDVNDNESFEYCCNKPNRWLGKAFINILKVTAGNGSLYNAMFSLDKRNWKFRGGISDLHSIINYLQNTKYQSVDKYVEYIRVKLNIDNFVLKGIEYNSEMINEKIENLNALQIMCKDYSSINDFLKYVTGISVITKKESNQKDSVKMMTLHKSKGLEFPIVFIIGCADEILPHNKATNSDDEKRLLYVGITRAEKELYMTYAKNKNDRHYVESPFIGYIKNTIEYKEK